MSIPIIPDYHGTTDLWNRFPRLKEIVESEVEIHDIPHEPLDRKAIAIALIYTLDRKDEILEASPKDPEGFVKDLREIYENTNYHVEQFRSWADQLEEENSKIEKLMYEIRHKQQKDLQNE